MPRVYLCNSIKKDFNAECSLHGLCITAFFKLSKHFQKHFVTKWQVRVATLLSTTCLIKIYKAFNSKGDLYCVKTTFVFECRCWCRCWRRCWRRDFQMAYYNFSPIQENSKYYSFLNNKPPLSWVMHITRDFLYAIPAHIIVSWYDTARATSDAITLPIQGKLSKVQKSSKSNLYDSNINWY